MQKMSQTGDDSISAQWRERKLGYSWLPGLKGWYFKMSAVTAHVGGQGLETQLDYRLGLVVEVLYIVHYVT